MFTVLHLLSETTTHVHSQISQRPLQILIPSGLHGGFHGPVGSQGGQFGAGDLFPLIIWVVVPTLCQLFPPPQNPEEDLLLNDENHPPRQRLCCIMSSKPPMPFIMPPILPKKGSLKGSCRREPPPLQEFWL